MAEPASSVRTSGSRLAVLGSPISHSKSPALHKAAYGVLGLEWHFGAIEVGTGELATFWSTLNDSWRGLAVTMPLKRAVMPLLDEIDGVAESAGAVNTVLLDGDRRRGYNTDVYGVTRALTELGVPGPRRVVLMGAGATAASVIVAVVGMGATELHIVARSRERADGAVALGESLGLAVTDSDFDSTITDETDVIVSTLPVGTALGSSAIELIAPTTLRATTPLLDIAYGEAPSELVRAWTAVGARAETGLTMLLHQAVQQVRVFVGGDPLTPLDDERAVIEAMRAVL